MPKAPRNLGASGGGQTVARPSTDPPFPPDNPTDDGWPADGQAQVPPVEATMAPAGDPVRERFAAAGRGETPAPDLTTQQGIQADYEAQGGPTSTTTVIGVSPGDGGPVGPSAPAAGSEVDGGAPAPQERTPEEQAAIEAAHAMDDPSGGDGSGAELPPIDPPKPARATKKATAPARRANPTPVRAAHQGEMAAPADGRLQLATLDDGQEWVNALLYGAEGVGKTTSVLTAANLGRVLVINAEGGIKTVPLRARGIDTANISVFPPPGHPELLTVDNLERLFWQVQDDLRRDPDAWFAVVWDSVTEIGTALLRNIVDREVAKNAALPEGSAKRQPHRESADFTDRSDYGVLSNQMLPLLRKYRDLPCHFLATALERRDVDEDTGRVMYGPATTPAVQTALLGYVDVAARVQNVAGENDELPRFVARTRPARTTRAKDRFGVTPPVMEDPTFQRVLQYVTGELTYEPPEADEVAPAAVEPAKKTPARKRTATTTAN